MQLVARPTPRACIVYFSCDGGNLSVWAPIVAGIARLLISSGAYQLVAQPFMEGARVEQTCQRIDRGTAVLSKIIGLPTFTFPGDSVPGDTNRQRLEEQLRTWLSPATAAGLQTDVVVDEGNGLPFMIGDDGAPAESLPRTRPPSSAAIASTAH